MVNWGIPYRYILCLLISSKQCTNSLPGPWADTVVACSPTSWPWSSSSPPPAGRGLRRPAGAAFSSKASTSALFTRLDPTSWEPWSELKMRSFVKKSVIRLTAAVSSCSSRTPAGRANAFFSVSATHRGRQNVPTLLLTAALSSQGLENPPYETLVVKMVLVGPCTHRVSLLTAWMDYTLMIVKASVETQKVVSTG